MRMKKRVVTQIKEMTAEFNEDALTPYEAPNISFEIAPNISEEHSRLGSVYLQVVAPENCYTTGKAIEVAVVNQEVTASLYALDHHGKPYTHSIDRVTCELTSDCASERDAKTIEGSIKRLKGNQYEISYCPTS